MRTSRFARAALVLSIAGLATSAIAQVAPVQPSDRVNSTPVTTTSPQPPAPPAPPAATPAAAVSAAAVPAEDRGPVETFRGRVGDRQLLPAMNYDDFFVTNKSVIEVRTTDSGMEVTFRGAGSSNLEIMRGGEKIVYRFVTITQDLDKALDEVRRLLADLPGVQVERVGDALVASGKILLVDDARKFEKAIERYDVIDLVERGFVEAEQKRLREELLRIYKARGFDTVNADLYRDADGDPFILLSGIAYTDQMRSHAESLAGSYFQDVTNQIVLDKPEIQLDIILVTVDLDRGTERGPKEGPYSDIKLSIGNDADPDRGYTFQWLLDRDEGDVLETTTDPALFGTILDGQKTLPFLKTESNVVNFVEAFQVVKSGETATFNDGGSIYVALVGSESQSVAEIETGLRLSITPVVEDNRKITSRIQLDYDSTTSDGTQFQNDGGGGGGTPGTLFLKSNSTSSTLTAENGQTLVVSGINSDLYARTRDSVPLLEKVPVLNLLFKKQSRSGKNVRSFFFVTPNAPTLFSDGRVSIAQDGQQARDFYAREVQYDIPRAGFYLGWEGDRVKNKVVAPAPWDAE